MLLRRLKQDGVIGSRMTGAGFGGCTVSIVKNDNIDAFIENVGKEYKDTIGYAADFLCSRSRRWRRYNIVYLWKETVK